MCFFLYERLREIPSAGGYANLYMFMFPTVCCGFATSLVQGAMRSPPLQPPKREKELVTPRGYERWSSGLYKQDGRRNDLPNPESRGQPTQSLPEDRAEFLNRVYPKQLEVVDTALDAATGEHWGHLACDDEMADIWLTRETCASNLSLSKQSKHGFSFAQHSCHRIVDFILASTAEMRPGMMSSRQGVVETPAGKGWLLGDQWIGPDSVKVHSTPNISKYAQAIGQSGRLDTWTQAFSDLIATAGKSAVVARWLTFAMFAAPLLRLTNYRTFCIHHYGNTAGGKSAMADFGASVWGRPKDEDHLPKLVGSFNATALSVVEQFRHVDDLPVIIDELQAATFKDHSKAINNLVMQIVLGQSRQRLKPSGEPANKPVYWRSVVRFNGEQPLIGNSSLNLGGVTNRILQLRADAMKGDDAKKLHQWMERERCYGVAGHAFLSRLLPSLNDPEKLKQLRGRTQDMHEEIDRRCGTDDRRTAHLAVIAMAQRIAARLLLKVPDSRAKQRAIEDALDIAQLADLGEQESYEQRGWDFLDQHIAAEPQRYIDLADEAQVRQLESGKHAEIIGVLNKSQRERRWYIPSKVNKVLRDNGFNPDRFWDDARLAGRIGTTAKGNTMPERTIGKSRVRVFVVTG